MSHDTPDPLMEVEAHETQDYIHRARHEHVSVRESRSAAEDLADGAVRIPIRPFLALRNETDGNTTVHAGTDAGMPGVVGVGYSRACPAFPTRISRLVLRCARSQIPGYYSRRCKHPQSILRNFVLYTHPDTVGSKTHPADFVLD